MRAALAHWSRREGSRRHRPRPAPARLARRASHGSSGTSTARQSGSAMAAAPRSAPRPSGPRQKARQGHHHTGTGLHRLAPLRALVSSAAQRPSVGPPAMLSACSFAADRAVPHHQPSIRQPAHCVRRQRRVSALHVGKGVAVGEAEARGGGEADRKARAPVRPQPLQQLAHVVRRAGRHPVRALEGAVKHGHQLLGEAEARERTGRRGAAQELGPSGRSAIMKIGFGPLRRRIQ